MPVQCAECLNQTQAVPGFGPLGYRFERYAAGLCCFAAIFRYISCRFALRPYQPDVYDVAVAGGFEPRPSDKLMLPIDAVQQNM